MVSVKLAGVCVKLTGVCVKLAGVCVKLAGVCVKLNAHFFKTQHILFEIRILSGLACHITPLVAPHVQLP